MKTYSKAITSTAYSLNMWSDLAYQLVTTYDYVTGAQVTCENYVPVLAEIYYQDWKVLDSTDISNLDSAIDNYAPSDVFADAERTQTRENIFTTLRRNKWSVDDELMLINKGLTVNSGDGLDALRYFLDGDNETRYEEDVEEYAAYRGQLLAWRLLVDTGIFMSGASTIGFDRFVKAGEGGAVLSGAASTSVIVPFIYATTGTMYASGDSTCSGPKPFYYTATGSMTCSGEATSRLLADTSVVVYNANYVDGGLYSYTPQGVVAKLTSTKFITAIQHPNGHIGCIVGTINPSDPDTISFGTEYSASSQMYTGASCPVKICALSSTKFAITFTSSADEKARVLIGEVSGTTITYGTTYTVPYTYTATKRYALAISALDSSTLAMVYVTSGGNDYSVIGVVSGTAIAFGDPYLLGTTNANEICVVDSDQFFISSGSSVVLCYVHDTDEITVGSAVSASGSYGVINKVDATTFISFYISSTTIYSKILSITGDTTFTASSATSITDATTIADSGNAETTNCIASAIMYDDDLALVYVSGADGDKQISARRIKYDGSYTVNSERKYGKTSTSIRMYHNTITELDDQYGVVFAYYTDGGTQKNAYFVFELPH